MNILILGGGGREHALAWAIRQNPKCDRLIVAPGNAGIAMIATCAEININSRAEVLDLAQENAVDFIVIGPEAPLDAGISDALRDAGFLVFGPSQAAAKLESSKAFTKEICNACNAPTAGWAQFTDLAEARRYVETQGAPLVVKADGLAAGKGVTVAESAQQANEALEQIFQGAFGESTAVIEEFMPGEEASFFVLCDGEHCLPIGTAQDHKRAFDGDTGPNTGGMGAYSPAPVLTEALQDQVMAQIITPTVQEMARRGTPFQGVLYAGLMIEEGQARLVEYNVRFGDPECQALMIRLGAQALDLLLACADGRLDQAAVNWAQDHAMTVIMAANGYPGDYQKGSAIKGLDNLTETSFSMMFHAGTKQRGSEIVSDGGRVLAATGRGKTLAEAQSRAYALIDQIDWPEGFCRRDIGWRAL